VNDLAVRSRQSGPRSHRSRKLTVIIVCIQWRRQEFVLAGAQKWGNITSNGHDGLGPSTWVLASRARPKGVLWLVWNGVALPVKESRGVRRENF